MKEALKTSWWKLPLYCLAAGWVSYQIKIRLGPLLAVTRLPDGTVTLDSTRWILLSVVLFLAVLAGGGLVLCRRMTRQEVFASATVLVVWNAASNLLTILLSGWEPAILAALFLSQLEDWRDILSQLLCAAGFNPWFAAAIGWASPWLFVPFGKKAL